MGEGRAADAEAAALAAMRAAAARADAMAAGAAEMRRGLLALAATRSR